MYFITCCHFLEQLGADLQIVQKGNNKNIDKQHILDADKVDSEPVTCSSTRRTELS